MIITLRTLLRRNRKIFLAAILLATAALIIPIIIGGHDSIKSIANLPSHKVAALAAFMLCTWSLNTVRLVILLGSDYQKLGYWHTFKIYMATEFFSRITPAGTGAPIAAVTMLATKGINASTTYYLFGVTTLLDALVITSLTLLICTAGISMPLSQETALGASGAVITGICAATYLIYFKHKQTVLIVASAGKLLPLKKKTGLKLIKFIIRAHRAVKRIANLPTKTAGLSIIASIIYWIFYLSTLYLVIIIMGGDVSIITAVAIQLVAMTIGHLSMTPGGVVSADISGAIMLAPLLGSSLTGAVILLWRTMMLYAYLAVGAICFFFFILDQKK